MIRGCTRRGSDAHLQWQPAHRAEPNLLSGALPWPSAAPPRTRDSCKSDRTDAALGSFFGWALGVSLRNGVGPTTKRTPRLPPDSLRALEWPIQSGCSRMGSTTEDCFRRRALALTPHGGIGFQKELRRRSVTRVRLWKSIAPPIPDGFGYTCFCTNGVDPVRPDTRSDAMYSRGSGSPAGNEGVPSCNSPTNDRSPSARCSRQGSD